MSCSSKTNTNSNATAAAVAAGFLLLGFVLFVMASGCDESPPPKPVHYIHVDTSEIPAYDIGDSKVDLEDFQLVTLPDGHDYWIYVRKNNDRGYGGMAHSPECKRCTR